MITMHARPRQTVVRQTMEHHGDSATIRSNKRITRYYCRYNETATIPPCILFLHPTPSSHLNPSTGRRVWRGAEPSPEKKSILHLKVAIFSAFCVGDVFFTVQLHVLRVIYVLWGLNLKTWLCHAYGEQKTPSQASLLCCCTNTINHPTLFHSTARYRPKLQELIRR